MDGPRGCRATEAQETFKLLQIYEIAHTGKIVMQPAVDVDRAVLVSNAMRRRFARAGHLPQGEQGEKKFMACTAPLL